MISKIKIEKFDQNKHSLKEITDLLHDAYSIHLKNGLEFWATKQDAQYTLERFKKGIGLIAVKSDEIIGTITYYDTCDNNGCTWYKKENVCRFGQFAVKTCFQKYGIGQLLIDSVIDIAHKNGKTELSLDTSEKAIKLVEYYVKKGFRKIDYMQWHDVNYRSIILSKAIVSNPPNYKQSKA